MLASRVSVSICILAIACVETTVRNVETINAGLENNELRRNNVTWRLWKRHDLSGINSDHIKRWNYFKETRRIFLWPKGLIPYVIGGGFTTPEKMLIWETISQFSQQTCIKFQSRRKKDRDYIEFKKSNKGCWSFIGRLKGKNYVEFDSGCLSRKTDVMHQLMHVLGFYDQHNARDRDKWLKIGWDNIRSDKRTYFIISRAQTTMAQQPYDYHSIMHLNGYAFSKDSFQHSMWPLQRVEKLGPLSDKLNSNDIYKINKLYAAECKKQPLGKTSGRTQNDDGKKKDEQKDDKDKNHQPSQEQEKEEDRPWKEDGQGTVEEPNQNGKEPPKDKGKGRLTPQMICVFWPVSVGDMADKRKFWLTPSNNSVHTPEVYREYKKNKNKRKRKKKKQKKKKRRRRKKKKKKYPRMKRYSPYVLTDSRKIGVFDNYESYRQKCPARNSNATV